MKRFLSIILTLCLVMAMTVPALAADSYTPYGTNSTVTVEGITYYDVFGTGARDISDSAIFLKQVLEAVPAAKDGYGRALSLDKRWREISKLAIINYGMDMDYQYNTILDCIRRMYVNAPWSYGWKNYPLTMASSVSSADDAMRALLEYDDKMPPANKELTGMTSGGTAFWALDFISPNPANTALNNRSVAIGTIFYDFKLSYLNTGKELVSGITGLTTEEAVAMGAPGFTYSEDTTGNTYVSGVKNMSASEITTAQSLTTEKSLTVGNSFSSTQEYGVSEMVGTESKLSVGLPGIGTMEMGVKTELTAKQTFTSQSGSSTSNTETETVENSISVVLPAHTEVMLEQSVSNIGMTIQYDYPVVISYKVKTVILSNQTGYGGISQRSNETVTTYGNEYPLHSTAADNFYLRVKNAAVSGYEATYGDGINWGYNFNSFYGSLSDLENKNPYEVLEWEPWVPSSYANYLNVNRPLSVTGGALNVSASGTSSTVYGITPIYPLYKVSTDRAYDYDMTSGEQLYVDNIALRGNNISDVPYYGFSSGRGHWVLVDSDGDEIQNSGVAQLEKNPVSGYTSLIAGDTKGVVYLKYLIDENIYSYSTNIGSYTDNSDLANTAVVKVNVSQTPFEGGVEVSGTVMGYAGDPAINLDDCEGLSAAVTDLSGKHLNRPIVWDQKELESAGIKVENNYLTFTKAGTFHIRAASGGVSSGWVEVTAKPARVLNQLEIADNTQPSVLTVEIQGGSGTADLSPLVVSALDQYGVAWNDLTGLEWKCDDPAVTINGTTATASAEGTYDIYAQLGSIKSNTLKLIANPERALASIGISDATDPSILTVDMQGGSETADLSLLEVNALDQYGDAWNDLTGLEWKCDDPAVTINGTIATVSAEGIYDIYAQFGSIKSNTLKLIANSERALASIEISDATDPSILTVDVQGGSETADLSLLEVSALDQYGDAWNDLTGLEWKCDDPAVTINGTTATVSAEGIYDIYAQFGSIKSNTLKLIADLERTLVSIEISAATDPSILTVDMQGGSGTADLSLLAVSALDQYGDAWNDLTGLEWKCDDSAVTINGTTASVTKSGIYDIYAQIGDVKSNILKLTAYDGSVVVGAITPQNASMGSSGGNNLITLTGTNLSDGIVIAAFNASGNEITRQTTTGDGSQQTCTLSLPVNSSTAAAAVYTIKFSLDGGVNYQASPTATVSVSAASRSSGGGGGSSSTTVVISDTDVPLANIISFSRFIDGYSDGNFHGEDLITREQFVAILYRLNAKDTAPADKTTPSFSDVASDRWSYDAIEWALAEEIIESNINSNFRPGEPLTRAEMAVMLVKCLSLGEGAENTFTDLSGHKDLDYILKAVKAGIFNGYPDGTFGPDDNTTRAQAVTALIRYLLGEEPTDQMIKDLEMPFADVPKTNWAYNYVLLAVHGYN